MRWSLPVLLCAIAVTFYSKNHYNGGDLETYRIAVHQFTENGSFYTGGQGEKLPSLYFPSAFMALAMFGALPAPIHHGLFFFLGVIAIIRMTFIAVHFWPLAKQTSFASRLAYILGAWLVIIQGISSQLESGNVNLFLLYFTAEGLYLFESERPALGLFLMGIAGVVKPFLGLFAIGFASRELTRRPGAIAKAVVSTIVVAIAPLFLLGKSRSISLIMEWWQTNQSYIDCSMRRKCVEINWGITSLLYEMGGWMWPTIVLVVLLPLTLAIVFYARRCHSAPLLYCVIAVLIFSITPASRPYMVAILCLPTFAAIQMLWVDKRRDIPALLALVFFIGNIFISPTYLSRPIFQEAIRFRLLGFCVLSLLALLMIPYKMTPVQRPAKS